jgi:hypothetical protein
MRIFHLSLFYSNCVFDDSKKVKINFLITKICGEKKVKLLHLMSGPRFTVGYSYPPPQSNPGMSDVE